MEDNNQIDELYKKGLSKKYPFDEALWNAVEKELPQKRSKKIFWLWGLNGLGLLALLSTSIIFLNSDSSPKAHLKLKPNKESVASNQTLNAEKKSNTSYSEKEKFSNNVKEEKHTIDAQNGKANNDGVGKRNHAVSRHAETALIETEAKKSIQQDKSLTLEVSSQTLQEIDNKSTQDDLNTGDPLRKPSTPQQYKDPILATQSFELSGEIGKEKLDNDLKGKAVLSKLFLIESLPFIYQPISLEQASKNSTKADYTSVFKETIYMVELYAHNALSINKKLSGLEEQFLNDRKENELINSAYTFGVNLSRNIKWLELGVGFAYQRITEEMTYSQATERLQNITVYDTSYRLVNGNYNSNGNPVLLIEEVLNSRQIPTVVQAEETVRVENTFQRFQVPIQLGYSKRLGNILLNLRTGISANYSYQSRGGYLSENDYQLTNFDEEKIIRDLFLSHNSSFNLSYALNEKIALGGRYYYEYDLGSYTTAYGSKIQQQGLGVFISFELK